MQAQVGHNILNDFNKCISDDTPLLLGVGDGVKGRGYSLLDGAITAAVGYQRLARVESVGC